MGLATVGHRERGTPTTAAGAGRVAPDTRCGLVIGPAAAGQQYRAEGCQHGERPCIDESSAHIPLAVRPRTAECRTVRVLASSMQQRSDREYGVTADARPEQPGRLRDDGPFVRFWMAHTVTTTGTTVSSVVLPILVFDRTGSPTQTSARHRHRRPALPPARPGGGGGCRPHRPPPADGRRASWPAPLLVGQRPGGGRTGRPDPAAHLRRLPWAPSTAFVWFDAANFGALPALWSAGSRLVAATSLCCSPPTAIAFVVGPALGGLLATTIGPAQAMAVDSASYLVSGILLLSVRRPFRATASARTGACRSEPRSARACAGCGATAWCAPSPCWEPA